jgi:non-ribosomal peptide synthetase component E (peptide arylation enzyme)
MPHVRHRVSEIGELVISGPHIASRELSSDGHIDVEEVHTGDLCEQPRNGKILLIGRLKNTVHCGGFTLSAERLESELSRNPSLTNLVVGKAPHELLGEIPVLFVPLGTQQIALEAWNQLDPNMRSSIIPGVYEIDHVPNLPSGKIDRQAINELALRSISLGGGKNAR